MPSSRKVVIIGGVAAGPKAASKIARLDPYAEVTIVEKGKLLSYAGCGLRWLETLERYRDAIDGLLDLMDALPGVR